jgi:hypothetical protein
MRIQLLVDKDQVELIDRLRDATRSKSYRELVNHAFTLLNWALQQRAAGRPIFAHDEKAQTLRELQMPALEYVVPERVTPVAVHAEPAAATGRAAAASAAAKKTDW